MAGLAGCSEKIEMPDDPGTYPPDTLSKPPVDTSDTPDQPAGNLGKSYLWDESCVPEIHISITEKQWNSLLTSSDTKLGISSHSECNVRFVKDAEEKTVEAAAIRLYNNWEGNRPEGEKGETHKASGAKWNFANYEINFSKYAGDRTLEGVRKLILKSCYNDPSYIREKFCFDTFRKEGIWTIPYNTYCRLWIHVEGDLKSTYMGVYQMVESIDQQYLSERINQLMGQTEGNLWKCGNNGVAMNNANLSGSSGTYGADMDGTKEYTYMLMTNLTGFTAAKEQLDSFTSNFITLRDNEFYDWLEGICDVKFLLKTYALSVALGSCDDYWNTGNNYYLYFSSTDKDNYKLFFIPYDHEISLGSCCDMPDPGMQSPLNWGRQSNVLISKILKNEEYRFIYMDYLWDFYSSDGPLHYHNAIASFDILKERIEEYLTNDTGLRNKVTDLPRPGVQSARSYRLWDLKKDNFLKTRGEYIYSLE